ncbi:MAG: hypothetical protein JKY37_10745, partial [Nannocystaceae bacterium]|nr:hypothetical protein [Nannocystaceae bacterium]
KPKKKKAPTRLAEPPPPTTEHYGIASSAADKNEFPKRPAPDKPAPSEQAARRDSNVQLSEPRSKAKAKRPGSPQRFEVEFKLGPYLPNVDRRYDGPGFGPYATIYGRTDDDGVTTGKPRAGIMPVIGFDWQFFYAAGPLGLGTQVGFFRDKAQAPFTAQSPDGGTRSAADKTTFGMVPLALLLTYRFEYLADHSKVPLVPYGKGGLAYAFWWTRDGNGDISRNSQDEKGSGGVPGWQVNGGAMLRLDFIEPSVAKSFDKRSGINHTYVFGEFQLSRIANFGIGNAISLGDATWFAGLAMEF